MAQSLEERVWIIEQVGNQNDQPAPPYLAGDVLENFTDIGVAAGTAVFQRMQNLRQIIALRPRRNECFDAIRKCNESRGVLLLQN